MLLQGSYSLTGLLLSQPPLTTCMLAGCGAAWLPQAHATPLFPAGCRPLSADDKALLWRFRYAITAFPRALTKFLKVHTCWLGLVGRHAGWSLAQQALPPCLA